MLAVHGHRQPGQPRPRAFRAGVAQPGGHHRIHQAIGGGAIGSWTKNDIALEDSTVSRRHGLIANFANDVWLYDLHSARGTRLDGDAVAGRAFLDGVHRVMPGWVEIVVGARADLLV